MADCCGTCAHWAPPKWGERNDRIWPLRRWGSQCRLPRPTPVALAPTGATMGSRWPAAHPHDWCAAHRAEART